MNTHELAWAAGFFEGEGCISAVPRAHGGHRFQIQICQVDTEPLERFRLAVGVGSLFGPYQYKGNRQPHYRFQTASFEDTQAVIAMLWRWLSRRRKDQAKRTLLTVLAHYRHAKAEKLLVTLT